MIAASSSHYMNAYDGNSNYSLLGDELDQMIHHSGIGNEVPLMDIALQTNLPACTLHACNAVSEGNSLHAE